MRFQHDWRSYGNENREFAPSGLMSRREASINDVRIAVGDRRIDPHSTHDIPTE